MFNSLYDSFKLSRIMLNHTLVALSWLVGSTIEIKYNDQAVSVSCFRVLYSASKG